MHLRAKGILSTQKDNILQILLNVFNLLNNTYNIVALKANFKFSSRRMNRLVLHKLL